MEIMEYLCRAEQRGRMMAATITPCIPFKNECPIEGHPFLPNKKSGILLVHHYRDVNYFSRENGKRKDF